ncbi:MAG: hypothetical protein ABI675_23470 [Chitinophagaceae bacterium]
MKKIMITMAMMVTLITGAFAGEEKIKPEVLDAFNNKFTSAQDVTWMAGSDYYKAAFNYNGAWLFAYYNATAKLLRLTRNISSTQLPFPLQAGLKKKYADYWITDLVEESTVKGFSYYITLGKADQKIILKSKNGGDWEIYQPNNK